MQFTITQSPLELGLWLFQIKKKKIREKNVYLFHLLNIYAIIGWFLCVPWPAIEPTTLVYGDNPLTDLLGQGLAPFACFVVERLVSGVWSNINIFHYFGFFINSLDKIKVLRVPAMDSYRGVWDHTSAVSAAPRMEVFLGLLS